MQILYMPFAQEVEQLRTRYIIMIYNIVYVLIEVQCMNVRAWVNIPKISIIKPVIRYLQQWFIHIYFTVKRTTWIFVYKDVVICASYAAVK